MKRILALLLSVVFILSLTACGKDDNDKDKSTVDLEYHAALGQIPECEYKLGDDPDVIKTALEAASEENEENLFYFDEGEESCLIDNGIYNFYYKNENKGKGVSYIVSYDTAFGFEIGTVSIEIANAIDADFSEEEITEDNAFFVWGTQNGKVFKYKFDDATVLFVFSDNALCATAIYNSDWE